MISQLHTPIPLQTPKGSAWAVAIIDYGPQWDLQWVAFVQDTGECSTFPNSQIRQEPTFSFGVTSMQSVHEPVRTSRPVSSNQYVAHNENPPMPNFMLGRYGN